MMPLKCSMKVTGFILFYPGIKVARNVESVPMCKVACSGLLQESEGT